jgi:integrase
MRRAELTGLDGDRPTWEIPGERTKNGRPHIVPLAPLALSIIEQRPVIGSDGLMFTSTGQTPISGFTRARERVEGWINERRRKIGKPPMPDWTLHDLRRTMVTMMNERLGIAPHIVEACVNHVSGSAKAGVAGVYSKALYINERRHALERWANWIMEIVGEPTLQVGHVVTFSFPGRALRTNYGHRE